MLLKHLLIFLQHSAFLGMILSVWHILIWQYLPLFFAKMLQICLIARTSPVHSPLQITPQIFNQIQIWTFLGPELTVAMLVAGHGQILGVSVPKKEFPHPTSQQDSKQPPRRQSALKYIKIHCYFLENMIR